MANPNPRVGVHKLYVSAVFFGDLVVLSSPEEIGAFSGGLHDIMVRSFGDRYVGVIVSEAAQRLLFMFKHVEDARAVCDNWEEVTLLLEKAKRQGVKGAKKS